MTEQKQLTEQLINNTNKELAPVAGSDYQCELNERDRVKILSPSEYAGRKGYIVESHKIQNNQGLIEVELDHILSDAKGYETITKKKRDRITITDPNKQLMAYLYMKSDHQHFGTDMRAESFLGVGGVATFILGFAISDILGIDKTAWNYEPLFYAYLISQSLTVGLGFYCTLILSFVGLKIKRLSGQNNLSENGAVHDDCVSYYWFKSKHWKPWWMLGKDASPIEWLLSKTGKVMISFFGTYVLSIILFVADQVEWYWLCIVVPLMVVPSLFAVHMIRNRNMLSFA
eukprot:528786_1